MSKKIVFGCWSNELHVIAQPGMCGVVCSVVFPTEVAARKHYENERSRVDGDRIIRMTVEDLGPVFGVQP